MTLMELILDYTAHSFEALPAIVLCFIGIAAFKAGLQRFGILLRIKLWLVFIVLWLFGYVTPFFIPQGRYQGEVAFKYMVAIGLAVFVLGVLFWIASCIFGVIRNHRKGGRP